MKPGMAAANPIEVLSGPGAEEDPIEVLLGPGSADDGSFAIPNSPPATSIIRVRGSERDRKRKRELVRKRDAKEKDIDQRLPQQAFELSDNDLILLGQCILTEINF
jgi:hypothetical protein